MLEILSPAGNMASLKAAISAGCDAIYLSGKSFGARSFADNFTNEELVQAINLCHLYGIKVYVTLNTLIYDSEVEEFMNYVDFLHSNNVDAVIMQDLGMIDLVRKTYPNLDIHMSTQGNIHNLEGVKMCEELGIKRVVLARETPIELIKEIKEKTNIEIEIFIHGALCMSYSGECLMSALIGSRSGNRGTCAQCCRQKYSLEIDNKIVKKDEYLLSTKDLNTLDYIGKLIEIGVDSLKIEGRMKREEYVFLTTNTYRRAIDNYVKYHDTKITLEDIKDLKKIFNREFTKGFIFGEDNDNFTNTYKPNHMGIEIGKVIDYSKGMATIKLSDDLNIGDGIRIISNEDIGDEVTTILKDNVRVKSAKEGDIIKLPIRNMVIKNSKVLKTTDYEELKEIQNKIANTRKVKIDGKCILKVGYPIKLILDDYKNKVEVYSDYLVEKSIKDGMTKDDILEKLNKLGNTIYEFNNLEILIYDNVFVPASVLNELRRQAIEKLNDKRLYKTNYKKEKYSIKVNDYKKEFNKNILINTYDDYLSLDDSYNTIYVDNINLLEKLNDKRCVLKLDRINEYLPNYDKKVLCSDLGSIYKYNNVDTDFSLNVVNSYTVAFLHSIGVNKITLSYELNYNQIKYLVECYKERYNKRPNLEVIVESNAEAMVCKYNILKKYNKKEGFLIDKFNNKYKIKVKNNLMYIYDYKKTKLIQDYFNIGINNTRINL